jgi:site-specific DNA-methyltransferase (adenine-specific)
LKDLVLDDRNPNRGTERGLGLLEMSLRRYGAGRSVLADRHGRVIAGNKTVERAAELGLPVRVVQTDGRELVVVQREDLDLEKHRAARELAIADNRVGQVSLDWDPLVLKSLLEEGVDLDDYFSSEELAEILGEEVVDGPAESDVPALDRAAELEAKWKTSRGQLWTIPSRSGLVHRLMCGDSTDGNDVRRLAGECRAVWMWTDPPYGVDYVGKTGDALRIQNDGADQLPELLQDAFACADEILAAGAPIYLAHPAGALSVEFGKAFLAVGWHLHQTLVWVKDSMVLGHSDYHYRHEPILYGWKPGKPRPWFGERDQVSVFEIPRPKVSELHPTIKPTELVAQCLRNSSRPGGLGYDPFCGSGTTLVAAEQTGRICLALEIDPKYVAVALERLSVLGLEPRLEG